MNELHIVHLYPNELNTYGDRGNLLTLIRRAEWHGLRPVVHYYHLGDELPERVDLILGGGGQDTNQTDISRDLQRLAGRLHELAADKVPMLAICATYQLFGHRFITHDGLEIEGIGIFDVETTGGSTRMIGNIAVQTADCGVLYGFENHSGRTLLGTGQRPLGTVLRGNGNNGGDKTEGARTHNVFGTYMHGPVLPNNPAFADQLIALAARRRDPEFKLRTLDDTLSNLVRQGAANRKY